MQCTAARQSFLAASARASSAQLSDSFCHISEVALDSIRTASCCRCIVRNTHVSTPAAASVIELHSISGTSHGERFPNHDTPPNISATQCQNFATSPCQYHASVIVRNSGRDNTS